jgi:hypothetical protein
MFEFKDENKKNNILKVKELLEKLENKIDVINKIEVGINFDTAARAMDLSLYSTFDSKEDLNTYATHVEHLKVVEFIKEVTLSTKVSDYTL